MPETGSDWTRFEVEAVVAGYLAMFERELRGEPYNKSAHRRRLAELLPARSEGSIEFKHANISAVLLDLHRPYISGYKPRSNYQALLHDVVAEQIADRPYLDRLIGEQVEAAAPVPTFDDILRRMVEPPREETRREVRYRAGARVPGGSVDYLLREARNASLGQAGEAFVLTFEQARLVAEGRERLAADVEHVSRTRGDHLGYDVLSFESSGAERLIEVKTTGFGQMTPFYVSRNQVDVSAQQHEHFHLYRVFDFRKNPRLFALKGELRRTCELQAWEYRARPG